MARYRILVIEDEAAIREGIEDALSFEGFSVISAADGRSGKEMALSEDYDLLLLDLALPFCDGLEILRELKQAQPTKAVIILSARGGESDRVAGLKCGADDYVVKPFGLDELLARIEAVLRRSPERPTDIQELAIPGGRILAGRRELRFDDGEVTTLSEKEWELLRYLAVNRGRPVSRDELLLRVWQVDPKRVATRTIDMHVARLREKLREPSDGPRCITTVRGRGYLFAHPAVT